MKIKTRLYCPNIPLEEGTCFVLDDKQAHYLRNVMRITDTDYIGVFNGIDGEYGCQIAQITKKNITLKALIKIRPHLPPTNIALLFAIIKKTPMEFLVQKATELGVGVLQPIITDRTVVRDLNIDRLEVIAIEAAEQCGLTAIPQICTPQKLDLSITNYHNILFCDESGQGETMKNILSKQSRPTDAIIIGPEGGFTPFEAAFLAKAPNTTAVSLGKRIMRAETAAIASLAIIQSHQQEE